MAQERPSSVARAKVPSAEPKGGGKRASASEHVQRVQLGQASHSNLGARRGRILPGRLRRGT